MMELRPIPFVDDTKYRIDRTGTVYRIKQTTRLGQPDRTYPIRPMARLDAENMLRDLRGGSRKGGALPLVFPPFTGPAGELAMVWCVIHCGKSFADEKRAWAGPIIHANGDLQNNWYTVDSAQVTFLFHGPSVSSTMTEKFAPTC